MRILLTGATGFIGRALIEAFDAAGHELILAVRDETTSRRLWPKHRHVRVDFARDHRREDWRPRLDGVDVVVNAVGLFRERGAQTFEALHVRAPQALFAACAETGVRRVIQVSALGADDAARSRYHLSKREADRYLRALPVQSVIVQPSLVFAAHGASAQLFAALAALPLVPVPGRGGQCLQPVHLDDVCAAIVRLVAIDDPPARLALVGPAPVTLRAYLSALRRGMGLGQARFVPVPMALVRTTAAIGARLPATLLDRDALAMLERGNCADAAPLARVLGRQPRAPADFIAVDDAPLVRREAKLRLLLPVLRLSVALVWIVTGIVSLGLYPVADSLALLARVGLTGAAATLSLYGAAAIDLLLGIATLALHRRRTLYKLQMLLILGYTAIITLWLPEFWLHPYGPVLKNLPLLAAIWLLHDLEERPWNT